MANTPRLPIPGQDANGWGVILNEYLRVSHHEDGTPKSAYTVANVRDFGARGDGVTDDTNSIKQAIDASAGRIVFVPAGTYLTRKLKLSSGVTIAGTGNGSILKLKDGTCDALFTNLDWATGNDHIMIRDLRLEGNRDHNPQPDILPPYHSSSDPGPSHGINFRFVHDSIIERMYINDFYLDGIYLGSSDPDSYPAGVEDLSDGSNRNMVCSNRIVGNGRNGISITRGTDNTISGNLLCENNKGVLTWQPEPEPNPINPFPAGALDIEVNGPWYDVSRNSVIGNHFLNNYYNGIQILGGSWAASGILVSSNVISGTTRHGIAAAKVSHLVIQGNYVASQGGGGMALGLGFGIRDAVVTGNIVYRNGSHGILLNGSNGERIIVIGNTVTDNAGIGIACDNSNNAIPPKQVVIIGNTVFNNGEQIHHDGADPVFMGNFTGETGIGVATQGTHRSVTLNTIFGLHWRMYGDDTGLFVENMNTGQQFTIQLAPLP